MAISGFQLPERETRGIEIWVCDVIALHFETGKKKKNNANNSSKANICKCCVPLSGPFWWWLECSVSFPSIVDTFFCWFKMLMELHNDGALLSITAGDWLKMNWKPMKKLIKSAMILIKLRVQYGWVQRGSALCSRGTKWLYIVVNHVYSSSVENFERLHKALRVKFPCFAAKWNKQHEIKWTVQDEKRIAAMQKILNHKING